MYLMNIQYDYHIHECWLHSVNSLHPQRFVSGVYDDKDIFDGNCYIQYNLYIPERSLHSERTLPYI